MDFLQETEKRALRYDFTAKEVHDLSLSLAAKTKELQAVDEERKTVASQYAAKMKEIKAATNKLSNLVADGFELRDIECEVKYHHPTQGKKTIIRKDMNKVTSIETMTDYDWNLFNQPPDDDSETPPIEQLPEIKPKKKGGRKKKLADLVEDQNDDSLL